MADAAGDRSPRPAKSLIECAAGGVGAGVEAWAELAQRQEVEFAQLELMFRQKKEAAGAALTVKLEAAREVFTLRNLQECWESKRFSYPVPQAVYVLSEWLSHRLDTTMYVYHIATQTAKTLTNKLLQYSKNWKTRE